MPGRFQFSLQALLAIMMLAALATWLVTLGGFVIVVAFPLIVAVLWGIYREDSVFLCAFLLVVGISVVFMVAASMRG